MLYNTTTIPSTQLFNIYATDDDDNICFFNKMVYFTSSMLTVSFFTFLLLELYLFIEREKEKEKEENEYEDEEEDEEKEGKYYEAFSALEDRELSEEEITNLHLKTVCETTDEGLDIVMTYHKPTEAFWYYTDDLKKVTYEMLNNIAQKFAIEYNCKRICFDKNAKKVDEPVVEEKEEKEEKEEVEEKIKTVFAKFKKYNTPILNNKNSVKVLGAIEQSNHFRYKGKLYEQAVQETVKEVADHDIDYATFKKMMQEVISPPIVNV